MREKIKPKRKKVKTIFLNGDVEKVISLTIAFSFTKEIRLVL